MMDFHLSVAPIQMRVRPHASKRYDSDNDSLDRVQRTRFEFARRSSSGDTAWSMPLSQQPRFRSLRGIFWRGFFSGQISSVFEASHMVPLGVLRSVVLFG